TDWMPKAIQSPAPSSNRWEPMILVLSHAFGLPLDAHRGSQPVSKPRLSKTQAFLKIRMAMEQANTAATLRPGGGQDSCGAAAWLDFSALSKRNAASAGPARTS